MFRALHHVRGTKLGLTVLHRQAVSSPLSCSRVISYRLLLGSRSSVHSSAVGEGGSAPHVDRMAVSDLGLSPLHRDPYVHGSRRNWHESGWTGGFGKVVGVLGGAAALTWAAFIFSGPETEDPPETGDPEGVISFGNARASFEAKSTWELFRALCIVKVCRIKLLIDNLDDILFFVDKVGLTPLAHLFMRYTFYSHFCAGADHTAAQQTVSRLDQAGVGAVIDLSVEDDPTPGTDPEVFFDGISRRIKEGIDVASAYQGNFVAVKITALTSYSALHHASDVFFELQQRMQDQGEALGSGRRIPWSSFVSILNSLRIPNQQLTGSQISDMKQFFKPFLSGGGWVWGEPSIDWEAALISLDMTSPVARHVLVGSKAKHYHDVTPRLNPRGLRMTEAVFNDEQYETVVRAVERLSEICQYAKEKRVRVMLDQEYYEIKPALDWISWSLALRFNPRADDKGSDDPGPLVYNTYQCYLKESYHRVKLDLARYKKQGILFGAKIVRGAYMNFERKRAALYDLPSPINVDKAATDKCYNDVVDHLLEVGLKDREHVQDRHVCFMIATHNEKSVQRAVRMMHANNVQPDNGVVHFGQLLGMCDHVSFMLGARGYDVLKYCPFGEVGEVMPYLIRRAVENSDVMGGTQHEVELLAKELRRRLTPWTS